jgi:hypothetical protein
MPAPERFDLTANLILVHHEGALEPSEVRFLEGLASWRGPLTRRQLAALQAIWVRIQGEERCCG